MKSKTALLTAAALLAASLTSAHAAEAIVGMWKRNNGTLIKYSGSSGRYCGTVMSGKYKGQSIGCMRGKNGKYKGKVNALDEGKTYSGKATASGSTLKLSGCVLGVLCKTESLKRQ